MTTRKRRDGRATGGSRTPEKVELLENKERDLLQLEGTSRNHATIKVIGVGGGGGNAIDNMIQSGLQGVEFVVANTDAQALAHSAAPLKVQLGNEITRGLGCGADPDKGRSSALETRERIREILVDTDMVFVTAGLGG